jgi:nucleotide-binding universal stress UspA family protein
MFHNALVAIDGSPDAEAALTQAIDLAGSEHTRLTLLTSSRTVPLLCYLGLSHDGCAELDDRVRSWGEKTLEAARERVPNSIAVTTILTDDPIREALIEQVKRERHDLVIVGSRGRGAIRAALFGSVSHYVLNHSPIPVLVVRGDGQARTKLAAAGAAVALGGGS